MPISALPLPADKDCAEEEKKKEINVQMSTNVRTPGTIVLIETVDFYKDLDNEAKVAC